METSGGNSQGTYSFSGADDPLFQANTLDGFANAFLGNIKSYTEGQRVVGLKTSKSLEAFIQDNWRVSKRLTLDLGVRFSHLPAMQDVSGNIGDVSPLDVQRRACRAHLLPVLLGFHGHRAVPGRQTNIRGTRLPTPTPMIGTGLGGPGNMYPSYLAAGTLVPAVFNGIPTAAIARRRTRIRGCR